MVSKRWTWLTGTAWLFAALTNAHGHIHYCFDGREPPAAVHLVDGTDHDHEIPGHDATGDHEDLDLDLPNQALAKAYNHDLPALAPQNVRMDVPEASATEAPVVFSAAPPTPDPHHYRPPLRGPPR
jgi:hypothetical protein